MADGTSGPSSPVETDDDGRGRVYQRGRSRPLLEKLGLVSVAIGLIAIAFSAVVPYRPATANPVEVTADPVVGLAAIAGAGVLLVFLGFLAYYFFQGPDLAPRRRHRLTASFRYRDCHGPVRTGKFKTVWL